MKKILISTMVIMTSSVFGQIGIGTPTPRGALDINKGTTNNMGLVLPTNSDVNNIITPQGGNIIPGTIIYDSSNDCMRLYKGSNAWGDCLADSSVPPISGTITDLDCPGASNIGRLAINQPATAYFTITYNGGNGGSHNGQIVDSEGVDGLRATLLPGNFTTGTGTLTYMITGTPTTSGTATFKIDIGGVECTLSREVGDGTPPAPTSTANCNGWGIPSTPQGTHTVEGMVEGKIVKATITNPFNTYPSTGPSGRCGTTIDAGKVHRIEGKYITGSGSYYGSPMIVKFDTPVSNFKVSVMMPRNVPANVYGQLYHSMILNFKLNGQNVVMTGSLAPGCGGTITGSSMASTIDYSNDMSGIFSGNWFDEVSVSIYSYSSFASNNFHGQIIFPSMCVENAF